MRFIASFKDGVIASVEGVNTCFTYSGLIEGRLSGATRHYMRKIEERIALIEAGRLKGIFCFEPELMDEKAYYREIPKWIADKVMHPFPEIFNKVLQGLRDNTVYGKTCFIVDVIRN